MKALLALCFLGGLAAAVPPRGEEPGASPPREVVDPGDEELWKVWKGLSSEARDEVAEWFRLEASFLGTYQEKLILFLCEAEEHDPGLLPEVDEARFFDPPTHAPKEPTPRRWLESDDKRHLDLVRRVFGDAARDTRAWIYDWASGEVRRMRDPRDPELVFENALHGVLPRADLARALCLRTLDDGSERVGLQAFAHAYTDRNGAAYPGVTLYDAWGSGQTIEMPDIDVLGIVHTVLDEWRRWKAPVSASKQAKLYATVGDLYRDVRRFRALREALADSLLRGSPPIGDYDSYLLNFHALWEDVAADPKPLAERLPGRKKWESFLKKWSRKAKRDKKLMQRANTRWATLLADEARVRATLVWVLREYGALPKAGGR